MAPQEEKPAAAPVATNEQTLPERPKEEDAAKGPSKSALKKAAKEKEKAEKAAKRKAEEEKQKQQQEANDISKDDYGDLPMLGSEVVKPSGLKRVHLHNLTEQEADQTIVFRATVHNARVQSAKLAFLVLGQRLQTIQAVVAASETLSRQMVKWAGGINAESTVLVHGLVKKPLEPVKSTTISNLEIHIRKIYTIAKAEPQLPMQVEDAERPLPAEGAEAQQQEDDGRPIVKLDTRLNNRTIDLRGMHNQAIFTIKDGVCALFSEYLRDHGFVGVQTPKLIGGASESGASVFEVKYFNQKAFLAQSPQLHKQMLIASRFEKVFEICPVFRAENSNTARHLTEFTGLDLETTFEEDYHEVVELLENLLLHIFKGLKAKYARETALVRSIYHVDEFKLPEAGQVPRLSFAEGVKMLREAGVDVNENDDLSTPDEKFLGKLVLEKYGTDFYVLDQFPLGVRPFYTMPSPQDPTKSNSYDFFMRGQEILSGAQRVHDAEFLKKRMLALDPPVNPEGPGIKEYVDSFRYGCPPHAGAGMGLERIVMLWLGLPNIRLAQLFPRDPNRLAP
ncbi:aspartyl-tRNA synthetase [Xylona heveae TC161]|uniref:Aspartate--tRNA ligase, cytoplasmic n=1 Tax=Xylona heveae (strain CBS 132557 / TC161) TaxID=1328760 RepID=A0A164ZM67_XYLHT|nr:aspartyl-tRNA synthetase [Xylona heveae TC161]KZF19269.1 aspartyl-tRNA synthetase [Xylona heveae TC161]